MTRPAAEKNLLAQPFAGGGSVGRMGTEQSTLRRRAMGRSTLFGWTAQREQGKVTVGTVGPHRWQRGSSFGNAPTVWHLEDEI
jgi:hypothetical protein